MVKARGYRGGADHFRHQLAKIRPRREREAFLRLRIQAGEEAQVDWAHFGKVRVGSTMRKLHAFLMVLSYSRAIHFRFFFDLRTASFLRGHQSAFAFFGGVPRRILYDNLKSAVLDRIGTAIIFNPDMARFAGEWGFEVRPVGVYRGNEKGRVGWALRFVPSCFWPARRFTSLAELNAEAEAWTRGASLDRRWPDGSVVTVREAFEKEREMLSPLRGDLAPVDNVVTAKVPKWPFVRFDGNDYSVPHRLVCQVVTVRATDDRVRVLDAMDVVAIHRRCFDRRQQIEDPEHQKALREHKRRGRKAAA